MGNEQAKVSNSLDFPRDLFGVVNSYDDPCDRLPGIDDTCWTQKDQKNITIFDPDSKRSVDCTQSCKRRNTKRANAKLLDVFQLLPLGYEFRFGRGILGRIIIHLQALKPIKFDFVKNGQIMNPVEIADIRESGYDKLNILYDLTDSVDYEYEDQKDAARSLDRVLPVGRKVTLLLGNFRLEQSKPMPFGGLGAPFYVPNELKLYRPSTETLLVTFIP